MASPAWVLEEAEAKKIALRRRRLQERAVRIHDPRNTSIAVNLDALSQQVAESQLRRHREEEEQRQYQDQLQQYDQLAQLRSEREKQEKAEQREQLRLDWQQQQAMQRQRESRDRILQDSEQPYQLEFAGEDPALSTRQHRQQQEARQWLTVQVQEQRSRREQGRLLQQRQEAAESAVVQRCQDLRDADELCRRAEQLAIGQLNAQMAAEAARREAEDRRREQQAVKQHVEEAVKSSLLTEEGAVARSALGASRVLCHRWKGLTPEQRQEDYKKLSQQIQGNKVRQAALQAEERRWQEQAAKQEAGAEHHYRRQAEERRRQLVELTATNAQLAEQQRQQRQMEQRLYSHNQPTEEYFDSFGVYAR